MIDPDDLPPPWLDPDWEDDDPNPELTDQVSAVIAPAMDAYFLDHGGNFPPNHKEFIAAIIEYLPHNPPHKGD